MHKQKAFTLVEILIVIALLAILATATYIVINPARTAADTRNSQRSVAVGELLTAIVSYRSEQGQAVADLGAIATCPATTMIGTGAGNVNLVTRLVDKYISAIPTDPSGGTAASTGYRVCKTSTGRVTVSAPNAENGKTISASK